VENKSFSKYSRTKVSTELGSPRQVKRISEDDGNNWNNLDENETPRLRRGKQFSFGTIYPYTFDGLAYIATHHPNIIKDKDDYYYVLELPIDIFCHYCLLDWHNASQGYLKSELLRQDKDKNQDEYKFLRYVSYAKGDYVSLDPIRIGFHYKTLNEMTNTELQKLKNLKTFTQNIKTIKTIIIYVLKPLLAPVLKKGSPGGFFFIPSALQAKIDTTLREDKKRKSPLFKGLTALLLRKYFLYLNYMDGGQNPNYLIADSIDLWEHVSPAEINVNGSFTYLRNWNEARVKLETANKLFTFMETQGLMKGARTSPLTNETLPHPKGIFYFKDTKKYQIYFKRMGT